MRTFESLEPRSLFDASAEIVAGNVLLISGTTGDDEIRCEIDFGAQDSADVTINGASFDIEGEFGLIQVLMGRGNDRVEVIEGAVVGYPIWISGGAGDDVLRVNAPDAIIDYVGRTPSMGNVTLLGGAGNDVLRDIGGWSHTCEMHGGKGDDRLRAGYDDDLLIGGSGADTLWGNRGSDTLLGGAGNDILRGGDDSSWPKRFDLNVTVQDKDLLAGEGGDDFLSSAVGANDTMLGGAGDDTIEITGEGDVIDAGADEEDLQFHE